MHKNIAIMHYHVDIYLAFEKIHLAPFIVVPAWTKFRQAMILAGVVPEQNAGRCSHCGPYKDLCN